MSDGSVNYTTIEVQSVLPSGWSLPSPARSSVTAELNRTDRRKTPAWEIRVQDVADVDWDLEVKLGAVEKLGRMEALRQAMDKLYREALG